MPSAFTYVPPTDRERQDFNGALAAEKEARRDAYYTALKYYDGDHPDQLEVPPDEPDDNAVINLVKMAADRTATFIFPSVPKFETDPESIEDTEEEKYLKDFIHQNGGLALLVKLAIRGFLAGHCFVRVKHTETQKKMGEKPKFVVLDPTSVAVFWRADDVGETIWYEQRYHVNNKLRITDFVRVETPAGYEWRIYTYEGQQLDGARPQIHDWDTPHGRGNTPFLMLDRVDFNAYSWTLIEKAKHTHHIPPIIDFAHLPHPDDYYGATEFTQKDLQDTINRIVSLMNRISRQNSDPVDVLLGADAAAIEDEGQILAIPQIGAKVQRLEMSGDLNGIEKVLTKLMETWLAVARVVILKGEAKDLQRVTNAAVRTLFLDALAKNAVLRSSYGHALELVAQLVLFMGYAAGQLKTNPKDLTVAVKFAEPLPTDFTEIANQNAIQYNMGARSRRTAATKMGDDWQFEEKAIAGEKEQDLENQRASMELMQEMQPTEEGDDEAPPNGNTSNEDTNEDE